MKLVLALVLLLSASYSSAASYSKSGLVKDILIRTSDQRFVIFYLEGFSSAGDCKVFKNDVMLSLDEDEKGKAMYAMLLASHMASKPVKVVVDDTKRNADGSCKTIDLRVNR